MSNKINFGAFVHSVNKKIPLSHQLCCACSSFYTIKNIGVSAALEHKFNEMVSLLSSSLFVTWLCCVSAIPLDRFYPFGRDVGDAINTETLDGSSPIIILSRAFYFYGKDFVTVVVSAYFYNHDDFTFIKVINARKA